MRIPGSQRTETLTGSGNIAPLNQAAIAAPYQALAGMGETISGLGELLQKRQQKMQEERDYLDAINAQGKLEDYARAKKVEIAQLHGQDALDIYPLYQQDFEKTATDISSLLSEGARARFEALAHATRKTYLDSVSGHVATQAQVYTKDSRDAYLNSRTKTIIENPLSFDSELQKANAVIDPTTPGPEGVLKRDEFYKAARIAQLDTLLKKDNLVALGISEEYVDSIRDQIGKDLYLDYKDKFKTRRGAKVVFEKLSRTEQEKYLGSLSGHVAAQTKAYNIDSRDAWLSGRLKAIAENPLSFDDEIRLGNAKIESSTPGPEGVLEKDKFYKTARAAQLDVLLKKDNLVALGISEEYVDSIRDQIGKDLYLEYKDKFKTRRAAIEAKQREEAKRIKSDYELQIGNTVSGHINNKSYPDAIVAIDDAKVDDTAKRKLYSLVNTAIKTGKETATDPGINAQLLLKLQDPSYPRSDLRQDIADAALAGQITAERGSTYYNGLDDPVFKDEYFKSINSMYRQHFGWSSASETFFHPEGAISYDMAVNKLLGRIRKEGLIGADVRKAGIEIGLPLFADFWVKTKFMSPAEAALNIKRLAESAGIKVRKPSVEELGGEEKKEGDVRRPLTSFYE